MAKDRVSISVPDESITSRLDSSRPYLQTSSSVIEDKGKTNCRIEVILDMIANITALHEVSLVHVKSEYAGKEVDVSDKTLVIDGKADMKWSFHIDIDTTSEQDLDDLVSKPFIFTVYQSQGTVDQELMKQIDPIGDVVLSRRESFDSAISVYEKFTGEIIENKQDIRNFKKQRTKSQETIMSIKEKEKPQPPPPPQTKKGAKDKKEVGGGDESSLQSERVGESLSVSGMGTLDMLPLILGWYDESYPAGLFLNFIGSPTFNAAVDLKPVKSFEDDRMITYKNFPKLCVTVTIEKPLLEKPTILCFTIESIYNIPQIMMSPNYECRVCAWLPLTDEFERKQIFGHSVLVTENVEFEMKAWPNIPVTGDNLITTKYRLHKSFDNVRFSMEKNFERYIQKEKPKIVYNYIRRILLSSYNKTVLYNYLMRYRTILLEFLISDADTFPPLDSLRDSGTFNKSQVTNITTSSKGSGDAKKRRSNTLNYLHLMALVDVSPLVYPGVTHTRVACQLSTYHEKEVLKATGVKDSYFFPKFKSSTTKIATTQEKVSKKHSDTVSTSEFTPKKGKKGSKVEKVEETLKTILPQPVEEEEEEPSIKVFNEDGDSTIIIIEIEIDEPLVKARPVDDLIENLKDLIHLKPVLPKAAINMIIVEENYRKVILEICQSLEEHLSRYLQEKHNCQCSSQADFLTYLRRLGVYQDYTMTLRKAISILINKKFTSTDLNLKRTNKKHMDMIGKFFVYLVTKMNKILKKQDCSLTGHIKDRPFASMDATLFYARECCELKQYFNAEKYFMERLFLEQNNPNVWFDYALFQMEMDSPELAFEYLNEALSRQLDHANSLLLYGILLTEKGKMLDAETCLLTVLVHRPRWSEGWGILFLFYQKDHNAGGMAHAEDMAKYYLDDERTEKDYFMKLEDLAWTQKILPHTIFFFTAVTLLKFRMYSWAEDALAFELASHPGEVKYLLAVICYYQEDYNQALIFLEEAKSILGWNYALVTLSGHCHVYRKEYQKAKEEFYYVLQSFEIPEHIHMLYINCSRVLSILGEEQEARKIILKACKHNSTPHTWMIAGTFYYNENDLMSAEECFAEANLCNNRIAEVWAFLTLINLKMDRGTEAELCYQQSIKNDLDDASLLTMINEEIALFQERNPSNVEHPLTGLDFN